MKKTLTKFEGLKKTNFKTNCSYICYYREFDIKILLNCMSLFFEFI